MRLSNYWGGCRHSFQRGGEGLHGCAVYRDSEAVRPASWLQVEWFPELFEVHSPRIRSQTPIFNRGHTRLCEAFGHIASTSARGRASGCTVANQVNVREVPGNQVMPAGAGRGRNRRRLRRHQPLVQGRYKRPSSLKRWTDQRSLRVPAYFQSTSS